MKHKRVILIIFLIILLAFVVYLVKNNGNVKEMFSNGKKIEYYREKLANKYNINSQELEYISLKEEHTEKKRYRCLV